MPRNVVSYSDFMIRRSHFLANAYKNGKPVRPVCSKTEKKLVYRISSQGRDFVSTDPVEVHRLRRADQGTGVQVLQVYSMS